MGGIEKKNMLRKAAAAGCCMALLCAMHTAWALSDYLASFEKAYPAAKQTRIDNCKLCHPDISSSTLRNAYGGAYRNAGHSFSAIAAADSDGDGFSNQAEIAALSYPGDPKDKPVGSVQVTIEPQGARDAGAQWSLVSGGAWQDSGVMVTNVAAGAQTIQFKSVTGWVTPADQQITVTANQVSSAAGTYTRGQSTVPGVVGDTQAAATAAVTAAGLTVGLVTLEYSDSVPAGQVISQSPIGGSVVNYGTAVALKVSKGPQPVTVPGVVGLGQAEATSAITEAGLTVGVITRRHDAVVPEGAVISQTPAGGALASPGSAVGLQISLGPGPVTVPDVTGQTQAAASAAIQNAGLVVGTVTQEYNASVPAGRVVGQVPGANVSADAGSTVDLLLSQGPEPRLVPDVTSLTQNDAEAAITAAGFTVGQVNETASDTVPAGTVISQSPAAGTLLVPASLINLTVSSGPPGAGCACVAVQKGSLSTDGPAGFLGDFLMSAFGFDKQQLRAHRKP